MPEDIGAFADGTDDVDELGRRFIRASEVRDLMICAVQRRADERVHARGHPHKAHAALALELRYARQQHTGVRHQVTSRFEPQLELRVFGPYREQQRIKLGKIQPRLIAVLRYSEAPANIEYRDVWEILRGLGQKARRVLPAVHVEYAAADMRLQSHDARAGSLPTLRKLPEFRERHSEF